MQDIIGDPPFSNLDLISCRNLIIYLKSDVQRKVLALFYFALRADGYLLLGHSETVGMQEGLFKLVEKKWRIFQRVGSTRATAVDFPISKAAPRLTAGAATGEMRSAKQARLGDIVQRHLLQDYAPAAVLVDDQYQVLHYSGPTARYLEQPVGAPTQSLLNLVRPEMRTKLRAALGEALAESHRVTLQDTYLMRAGERVPVRVLLKSLTTPRLSERVVLITFADQPETDKPVGDKRVAATARPDAGTDAELLKQLEGELNAIRGELQSNIEEQESSNEELQAANEEVMSVNEEMQSSNEELETSKEELQSMNEELTTINSQLKDKVDELSQTNNDLANLLSSTEIATLFLDTEFRIRRFTPPTKRLFNLIATDIGRPLSDIQQKYRDGDLLADARLVLERLAPVESEVYTDSGEFYLRRVLPYRTGDDHIAGVVITFIDFTALKRADAAMQTAMDDAESANATKTRFLATASHDLRQPLQSLNLLNAALLKIIDNDKAQKMLTLQGESLVGMGRLLNSLLDISKLESGAVSVSMEDFALRPIIEYLVNEFAAQASTKGLRLGVAIASGAVDEELSVRADIVLLTKLLQNLIANAIRYTAQGFVQIDCERKGNSVHIKVRDSGVGIAEDQLTNIFEEFHQVDRDSQESHGGLGLGLSIAQRIATLLNTKVKVQSVVDEGSVFSLALVAGDAPPVVVLQSKDDSA